LNAGLEHVGVFGPAAVFACAVGAGGSAIGVEGDGVGVAVVVGGQRDGVVGGVVEVERVNTARRNRVAVQRPSPRDGSHTDVT
jgi:hypothetical protein